MDDSKYKQIMIDASKKLSEEYKKIHTIYDEELYMLKYMKEISKLGIDRFHVLYKEPNANSPIEIEGKLLEVVMKNKIGTKPDSKTPDLFRLEGYKSLINISFCISIYGIVDDGRHTQAWTHPFYRGKGAYFEAGKGDQPPYYIK
jgi:hypothetical protein